jgi:hypothetical protein
VGIAREAPKFQVAALSSRNRVIRRGHVETLKDGGSVYEVWLKPGSYSLRITAQGYAPLVLKELEVKTGHDLRIDLEFTEATGQD